MDDEILILRNHAKSLPPKKTRCCRIHAEASTGGLLEQGADETVFVALGYMLMHGEQDLGTQECLTVNMYNLRADTTGYLY